MTMVARMRIMRAPHHRQCRRFARFSLLVMLVILLLRQDQDQQRLSFFASACNRFYTSTNGGKHLVRINRRTGETKDVGKWKYNGGGDRIIETMEWNFPQQIMYGFMMDETRPTLEQRLVRINRQKPRGASIDTTQSFTAAGNTGRFDLRGMAVDGNDVYYAHSTDPAVGALALHEVDINTGLTRLHMETGLVNILDIGYRINTNEIWAVNGTSVFIIDLDTQRISELQQTLIAENPNNRIIGIAFNPVMHTPIMLTSGEYDSSGSPTVLPAMYWYILGNDTAVLAGETGITDGPPAGGTLQCKRRVFTSSPSVFPTAPTVSPQPTRQPFVSDQPSESPTTTPSLTTELEPVFIVLDSSSTVNETALQQSVEAYFFDIYSQDLEGLVAVDAILLNQTDLSGPSAQGEGGSPSSISTASSSSSISTASSSSSRRYLLSEEEAELRSKAAESIRANPARGGAAAMFRPKLQQPQHQQQHQQNHDNNGQQRRLVVMQYWYRIILVFDNPTSVSKSQTESTQTSAVSDQGTLEIYIQSNPSIGGGSTIVVLDFFLQPTPTSVPSLMPSAEPSEAPSKEPSALPSQAPSRSRHPSAQPSPAPSPPRGSPTRNPSTVPSRKPSPGPSSAPSKRPNAQVSSSPTRSSRPSSAPA